MRATRHGITARSVFGVRTTRTVHGNRRQRRARKDTAVGVGVRYYIALQEYLEPEVGKVIPIPYRAKHLTPVS